MNIILGPYTVWSLLAILSEGARGNTAAQLNSVLQIPANKDSFRRSFRSLKTLLTVRYTLLK